MKYTPEKIGILVRSTRKKMGVTQKDLAMTWHGVAVYHRTGKREIHLPGRKGSYRPADVGNQD